MDDERAERWRRIRAEWEAGATVAGLARTHGVSEKQIRLRKRAEGWARPTAASPTVTLVVLEGGRPHPPKAESPGGEPKPEPRTADPDADVTEDELARAMRRVAKKALDDLEAGGIKAGPQQSQADVIVRVVDTAAKAIDKSRDVAGKKAGQPSGDEAAHKAPRRFTFVTPAEVKTAG
jgi:hypothetical protein